MTGQEAATVTARFNYEIGLTGVYTHTHTHRERERERHTHISGVYVKC